MPPSAVLPEGPPLDPLDRAIAGLLERDGRAPASAIAQQVGAPESTVRRRLAGLIEDDHVRVRPVVDPAVLGLTVDADLRLQVPPARLDRRAVPWPLTRPCTG